MSSTSGGLKALNDPSSHDLGGVVSAYMHMSHFFVSVGGIRSRDARGKNVPKCISRFWSICNPRRVPGGDLGCTQTSSDMDPRVHPTENEQGRYFGDPPHPQVLSCVGTCTGHLTKTRRQGSVGEGAETQTCSAQGDSGVRTEQGVSVRFPQCLRSREYRYRSRPDTYFRSEMFVTVRSRPPWN